MFMIFVVLGAAKLILLLLFLRAVAVSFEAHPLRKMVTLTAILWLAAVVLAIVPLLGYVFGFLALPVLGSSPGGLSDTKTKALGFGILALFAVAGLAILVALIALLFLVIVIFQARSLITREAIVPESGRGSH